MLRPKFYFTFTLIYSEIYNLFCFEHCFDIEHCFILLFLSVYYVCSQRLLLLYIFVVSFYERLPLCNFF